MSETRIIDGNTLFRILDYSTYVFLFCFLAPYLLGKGESVYGGGIGYKAFFFAQNELGLILVVLTFFHAYKLTNSINKVDLVKIGLLMICSLLLNTKTAILACLLAVLLWIIPIIVKAKMKTKLIGLMIVCVGAVILRETIIAAIKNSYSRLMILSSKHYGGSFFAGVLSGRNYSVAKAYEELHGKDHSPLRWLIGNGFCSTILTEMDLIDIFFYLGIIGTLVLFIWLLWIFNRARENTKEDKSRIRILSLLVVYGLLFFAGHVLFMAMSGCYFVVYCIFLSSYCSCQYEGVG